MCVLIIERSFIADENESLKDSMTYRNVYQIDFSDDLDYLSRLLSISSNGFTFNNRIENSSCISLDKKINYGSFEIECCISICKFEFISIEYIENEKEFMQIVCKEKFNLMNLSVYDDLCKNVKEMLPNRNRFESMKKWLDEHKAVFNSEIELYENFLAIYNSIEVSRIKEKYA